MLPPSRISHTAKDLLKLLTTETKPNSKPKRSRADLIDVYKMKKGNLSYTMVIFLQPSLRQHYHRSQLKKLRLDCSLLVAIGNALYESSGWSLQRRMYANY